MIFLGCPQDRHLIYDTWKLGNIDVGNIDNGAIRYVLDYINKDPIFVDSKYELYGDFEPPFYHFSKGLGFEEIERMISKGMFDRTGKTYFTSDHTYTLPPYLKTKFGFGSDNKFFKDNVIKWSQEKNISDLFVAQENRSTVVERCLVQSKVARGGLHLDFKKFEEKESIDYKNRFNGFTDYDLIDKVLGFN